MNPKPMSRGLRNNNPGNIRRSAVRYRGENAVSTDAAFKQFETIAAGYRALFVLLHTYRVKHGLHTLRAMIARYAPPVENDTGAYLEAVTTATGIGPDRPVDTLDRATMTAVAAAISRVENGVAAVTADVEAGWRLFAGI